MLRSLILKKQAIKKGNNPTTDKKQVVDHQLKRSLANLTFHYQSSVIIPKPPEPDLARLRKIQQYMQIGVDDLAVAQISSISDTLMAKPIAQLCVTFRHISCALALLNNPALKDCIPLNYLIELGNLHVQNEDKHAQTHHQDGVALTIAKDPYLSRCVGYFQIVKWIRYSRRLWDYLAIDLRIILGTSPKNFEQFVFAHSGLINLDKACAHLKGDRLLPYAKQSPTIAEHFLKTPHISNLYSDYDFIYLLSCHPSLIAKNISCRPMSLLFNALLKEGHCISEVLKHESLLLQFTPVQVVQMCETNLKLKLLIQKALTRIMSSEDQESDTSDWLFQLLAQIFQQPEPHFTGWVRKPDVLLTAFELNVPTINKQFVLSLAQSTPMLAKTILASPKWMTALGLPCHVACDRFNLAQIDYLQVAGAYYESSEASVKTIFLQYLAKSFQGPNEMLVQLCTILREKPGLIAQLISKGHVAEFFPDFKSRVIKAGQAEHDCAKIILTMHELRNALQFNAYEDHHVFSLSATEYYEVSEKLAFDEKQPDVKLAQHYLICSYKKGEKKALLGLCYFNHKNSPEVALNWLDKATNCYDMPEMLKACEQMYQFYSDNDMPQYAERVLKHLTLTRQAQPTQDIEAFALGLEELAMVGEPCDEEDTSLSSSCSSEEAVLVSAYQAYGAGLILKDQHSMTEQDIDERIEKISGRIRDLSLELEEGSEKAKPNLTG